MNPAIEICNLSFGCQKNLLLQEVNLTINKGDFVAFIGPNGSGKSTLLKLILNTLKPKKGEIKLLGVPNFRFTDWTKVRYISQKVREFNDSFPATVKELIASNMYHQMGFLKLVTQKLSKRIDQSLEMVGLSKCKNEQIGNLSGGQQQRVFIARTLVTEPEIILLDEPLVGIDQKTQHEIQQILIKLNQKLGTTIVMISHNLESIKGQSNKIFLFKDMDVFNYTAKEFTVHLSKKGEWVVNNSYV